MQQEIDMPNTLPVKPHEPEVPKHSVMYGSKRQKVKQNHLNKAANAWIGKTKKEEANKQEPFLDILSLRVTTIHGLHFFHSQTGIRLRVAFLIVFLISLTVMSYQLYDRLSHYLRNPISMEIRDSFLDSIPFPDIVICSSQQVRWSKLAEYEVFKDYEFVPISSRLKSQHYANEIDRFRSYLITSGYCQDAKRQNKTKNIWCDDHYMFYHLTKAFENEKFSKVGEKVSSLRLARNIFDDEGLYRRKYLNLTNRKWPEFKIALELYAKFFNYHHIDIKRKDMEQLIQNPKVLQNRSRILEHFLNPSFDYEMFRERMAGEPSGLVAACHFRGKDCDTNVTKTKVTGKVCFKISGSDIGQFRNDGREQEALHLLLDAHTLDVIMERTQPITVTAKFLGPHRLHTSPTEQVVLNPARSTRVILEKQRIENTADCSEKKLQLFDIYSRESCWAEKQALFVQAKCRCLPPLYVNNHTKETCRTTEQVFCAQEMLERKIQNVNFGRECGRTCLEDRYSVLQQTSAKLTAEDLEQFEEEAANWIPSEISAFATHFNTHHRVFKDLYNLDAHISSSNESSSLHQGDLDEIKNISAKCESETLDEVETFLTILIDDYLQNVFRFQGYKVNFENQPLQPSDMKNETSTETLRLLFNNTKLAWDRWQIEELKCLLESLQTNNSVQIIQFNPPLINNSTNIHQKINRTYQLDSLFDFESLEKCFNETLRNSSYECNLRHSTFKAELDQQYARFITVFKVNSVFEGHNKATLCTNRWKELINFSLLMVNQSDKFLPWPYFHESDEHCSRVSFLECNNEDIYRYFPANDILRLAKLADRIKECDFYIKSTKQVLGPAAGLECGYKKNLYENQRQEHDFSVPKFATNIIKLQTKFNVSLGNPAVDKWISEMIGIHLNDFKLNTALENFRLVDDLLSQLSTKEKNIEQTIRDTWPERYTNLLLKKARERLPALKPKKILQFIQKQKEECRAANCSLRLHERTFKRYNICVENELERRKSILLDMNWAYYRQYRSIVARLQRFEPGLNYNLRSMIRLDVTLGEMTETVITYTSYNVWTFLSEVGGTLGLYLGATFVSIFEIAALVVEQCRKHPVRKMRKKRKTKPLSSEN